MMTKIDIGKAVNAQTKGREKENMNVLTTISVISVILDEKTVTLLSILT